MEKRQGEGEREATKTLSTPSQQPQQWKGPPVKGYERVFKKNHIVANSTSSSFRNQSAGQQVEPKKMVGRNFPRAHQV